MSEALGDWLTDQLNRRGWSHNELGRRAGVSQPAVSGIIAGRKPSADFCIKIAGALDESPIMLLRLAGILPSVSNDTVIDEVVELLHTLTPENRQEVLAYIRFRMQQQKD